ncbi:hypothetical protein O0L34_g14216 [Tuta absoluta]|nr:hypothetical protein O0L34_g14216 [Tuta absoluta]
MMTFSRSHQPLLFQYSVGGTSMARVQRVRDLGVQFDPQLTFRDHVLNVAIAANRRLGFVLRNSATLTPTATQTLYAALLARLRPRARGPLAAPPTRTVNHEHSPVASVISLLNSVLVSNPQHDLCMTGLASLMKECKLVVEMNARGTSIKY